MKIQPAAGDGRSSTKDVASQGRRGELFWRRRGEGSPLSFGREPIGSWERRTFLGRGEEEKRKREKGKSILRLEDEIGGSSRRLSTASPLLRLLFFFRSVQAMRMGSTPGTGAAQVNVTVSTALTDWTVGGFDGLPVLCHAAQGQLLCFQHHSCHLSL